MKKTLLVLLALALPIVLGMGGGDVSQTGEMPKTTKNYNAAILDDTGTKTDVTNFASDGKLYFSGKKGETKVMVAFDKVKEVSVEKKAGGAKGEHAAVAASLTDGSSISFEMECRDRCTGNTGFGSVSIDICNVRKITIK